ncbi:MAG TPA: hypothetical protein VNB49_09095 [Candidatus Dormibacteraeota bacterium]|nr:hypothetical protein [Candidatus Dormibacteraeota bacterium]
MTRDENNRTSESRAFGATDNDDSTPHGEVSLQKLFFVGITLPEHKWIIPRERRGICESSGVSVVGWVVFRSVK